MALNSDLAFDTLNVTPVGISKNDAHNAFTVSNAGNYLINVVFDRFGLPIQARLTVNNTVVGPLHQGISFSRILRLSANDVVTVRNVGDPTVEVPAGAGITIVRIS